MNPDARIGHPGQPRTAKIMAAHVDQRADFLDKRDSPGTAASFTPC
jgi:hypothetical protein